MKIYALQGKGNIGKTYTLKTMIYALLKKFDVKLELYRKVKKGNEHGEKIINCVFSNKTMSADELKAQLDKEKAELEAYSKTPTGRAPVIRNIAGIIKANGKTIAVNVAGDTVDEIGLSLAFLELGIKIDVLICAIHPNGVTVDKLNAYCKEEGLLHGKDCFVITKSYWNNYDKDIKVASVIFDLCDLQANWLANIIN